MSGPDYIEVVVPVERYLRAGALKFIYDRAIENPSDRDQTPPVVVVKHTIDLSNRSDIHHLDAKQILQCVEVRIGLLIPWIKFQKYNVLRVLIRHNRASHDVDHFRPCVTAVHVGEFRREAPVFLCKLSVVELKPHQRGEALHLNELRNDFTVLAGGHRKIDRHERRPIRLASHGVLGAKSRFTSLQTFGTVGLQCQFDCRFLAHPLYVPWDEAGRLAQPEVNCRPEAMIHPLHKLLVPPIGEVRVELRAQFRNHATSPPDSIRRQR